MHLGGLCPAAASRRWVGESHETGDWSCVCLLAVSAGVARLVDPYGINFTGRCSPIFSAAPEILSGLRPDGVTRHDALLVDLVTWIAMLFFLPVPRRDIV